MEEVLIYIDDILVVTKGSFEEHLEKVSMVLERLRKKGMQINANKCEWFRKEVKYLGYLINKNGIRPMKDKVCKILALKAPTTASHVHSFLGMVN